MGSADDREAQTGRAPRDRSRPEAPCPPFLSFLGIGLAVVVVSAIAVGRVRRRRPLQPRRTMVPSRSRMRRRSSRPRSMPTRRRVQHAHPRHRRMRRGLDEPAGQAVLRGRRGGAQRREPARARLGGAAQRDRRLVPPRPDGRGPRMHATDGSIVSATAQGADQRDLPATPDSPASPRRSPTSRTSRSRSPRRSASTG